MTSAARRLTVNAFSKCERIHVLLPVPLGPKRKKDERGGLRKRVYITPNFTVKMGLMDTGGPRFPQMSEVRAVDAESARTLPAALIALRVASAYELENEDVLACRETSLLEGITATKASGVTGPVVTWNTEGRSSGADC
jgi:hypothetical protein